MNAIIRLKIGLLLFAWVVAGFSPPTTTKQEFTAGLKSLRVVLVSLINETEGGLRNTLVECRSLVNQAIIAVDQSESDYLDHHLKSIKYLEGIVRQMKELSLKEKQEAAGLLLRDLKIKFNYNAKDNLVTIFGDRLSKVIVRALGADGEVNLLKVNWAPLGFHTDFTKPLGSFGKLTSPAADEMVPGLYIFWLTAQNTGQVLVSGSFEIFPGKDNLLEFAVK